MTCGDCAFVQTLLNFPSVLYFCYFVLFRFVSFLFLTFDIFSGTHVRTCVQVATPLSPKFCLPPALPTHPPSSKAIPETKDEKRKKSENDKYKN